MYTRVHVKYPLLCQILMEPEFSAHMLEESATVKFHENPSSGSRVVPCGGSDVQTDMTKLKVALRNSANAPKEEQRGA